MKIYKIEADHTYKHVSAEDEATINQFREFKGQTLSGTWKIPRFQLLENITPLKSEKNNEQTKDIGFDARSYGSMLFIKHEFDYLFSLQNVELLPVVIESVEPNFSFLNVLNNIEAIDFSNLDYQQSMEMLKSNSIRFIREHIGGLQIFRDRKLINFYYCTEDLKTLIKVNGIKGLTFEEVGKAM
jgi:hypothetical protein